MSRLIDADAFCAFLREVSTRQHYETLLTNKDKYPTVADVIEAICCDLDGTSLNRFDNAPTIVDCKNCDGYEAGYSAGMRDAEIPKDEIFPMKIVAGKCPIDASGDCPLRPQGKWIKEPNGRTTDIYRCSVCKRSIMLCKGADLTNYPFCHCGADMRGGAEE